MIEAMVNQTLVKSICYENETYFIIFDNGLKQKYSRDVLINSGWDEQLDKIDIIINRKKKLEKLLS